MVRPTCALYIIVYNHHILSIKGVTHFNSSSGNTGEDNATFGLEMAFYGTKTCLKLSIFPEDYHGS